MSSGAMPSFATGAVVGLAADRVLGEPPLAVHPVARFGQVMSRLERSMYRDSRAVGAVFWAIGVGGAAACGVALQRALGRGPAVALATSVAVAGRMLGREASTIGALLEHGDIDAARERLPSLVGRSPAGLGPDEIARAVIESVAENSVDAVVAPFVWAVVAGAPGVLAHRAINTLDAMVGHRSSRYLRFGWASARVDDVANWMPARIGALLVMAARPRQMRRVLAAVRRDAPRHPSPNGGVIEAAYAAALGVRLGGSNRYGDVVEDRGTLGDGPPPAPADVARAVRLMDHTELGLAVAGATLALGRLLVRHRTRRLPSR
jgi:adenosylcobinamide-phosphate synthase